MVLFLLFMGLVGLKFEIWVFLVVGVGVVGGVGVVVVVGGE